MENANQVQVLPQTPPPAPLSGHHRHNSGYREQTTNSLSEVDDLVARSLPIKAGYPADPNQQLSKMASFDNDRAAYSHINPKDQWHGNVNGFGLTKNSQLKLKDSAMSNHKSNNLTNTKPKTEVKPIKYFYSLDEELEIDPDIAADMAKYLS